MTKVTVLYTEQQHGNKLLTYELIQKCSVFKYIYILISSSNAWAWLIGWK